MANASRFFFAFASTLNLDLTDKIAFVSGASRGIGAATARFVADEGADVIVGYHKNTAGAESTAEHIRKTARKAWLVRFDAGDPASVAAAMGEVRQLVPGIDAAILCAGTNAISPLLETSPSEWDDIIRVNLNGVFYQLRAVAPLINGGRELR